MKKPSPIVVMLFNVPLVLLWFLLIKGYISNPCVKTDIMALSWSLAALLFLHLAWRYLSPWLRNVVETVEIVKVKLAGKPLMELADVLHPDFLPKGVLWLSLMVFTVFPFIYQIYFPFRPNETIPIIQKFSIEYLGKGLIELHQPGDTINLPIGQQILVKPEIIGEWSQSCEWYSVKGSLLLGDDCSVLYTRSIEKGGDSLTITVYSSCQTLQTSKSLLIAP